MSRFRQLLWALLLLGISGCSRQETIRLGFAFWGDEAEQARIKHETAAFEAQNPGVRIELIPFSSRQKYLDALVARGELPDVLGVDLGDFAKMRKKGMLRDLSGKADDLFDFQPRLAECFFQDNKLWAVPASCSAQVLYYNKSKFDRAGIPYPVESWDWGDLKVAAERLTLSESGKVIQYGLDLDTDLSGWAAFLWQNGGEVVDPNTGKWVIGSPAMLEKNAEALQFYVDLIHQARVAPAKPAAAVSEPAGTSFEKHYSAMMFSGRSLVAGLRSEEGLGWDVSPMPKHLQRATTLSVQGYGISSFAKHPEQAWKLIRFLTGPTSQTKLAMRGSSIPARVSSGQSRVFLDFPGKLSINNRAFLESLYYARPLESAPRWNEVKKIIAEETDLLFSSGKGSARDCLIRAQSRIDKLFASLDRLAAPSSRKSVIKKP